MPLVIILSLSFSLLLSCTTKTIPRTVYENEIRVKDKITVNFECNKDNCIILGPVEGVGTVEIKYYQDRLEYLKKGKMLYEHTFGRFYEEEKKFYTDYSREWPIEIAKRIAQFEAINKYPDADFLLLPKYEYEYDLLETVDSMDEEETVTNVDFKKITVTIKAKAVKFLSTSPDAGKSALKSANNNAPAFD